MGSIGFSMLALAAGLTIATGPCRSQSAQAAVLIVAAVGALCLVLALAALVMEARHG